MSLLTGMPHPWRAVTTHDVSAWSWTDRISQCLIICSEEKWREKRINDQRCIPGFFIPCDPHIFLSQIVMVYLSIVSDALIPMWASPKGMAKTEQFPPLPLPVPKSLTQVLPYNILLSSKRPTFPIQTLSLIQKDFFTSSSFFIILMWPHHLGVFLFTHSTTLSFVCTSTYTKYFVYDFIVLTVLSWHSICPFITLSLISVTI